MTNVVRVEMIDIVVSFICLSKRCYIFIILMYVQGMPWYVYIWIYLYESTNYP